MRLYRLALLLPVLACGPGAPAPARPAPVASAAASGAADAAEPVPSAVAAAAVRPNAPSTEGLVLRAPTKSARPAGARPGDPPWFREDLFAGATLVKRGHTSPDAEGKISAQITLRLADGTTREECLRTVRAAVQDEVASLHELAAADRTTLTGEAERYTVTLICGEARGAMTAYLSWSGDPGEPAAPPSPLLPPPATTPAP